MIGLDDKYLFNFFSYYLISNWTNSFNSIEGIFWNFTEYIVKFFLLEAYIKKLYH